jgi:hypothetical protein
LVGELPIKITKVVVSSENRYIIPELVSRTIETMPIDQNLPVGKHIKENLKYQLINDTGFGTYNNIPVCVMNSEIPVSIEGQIVEATTAINPLLRVTYDSPNESTTTITAIAFKDTNMISRLKKHISDRLIAMKNHVQTVNISDRLDVIEFPHEYVTLVSPIAFMCNILDPDIKYVAHSVERYNITATSIKIHHPDANTLITEAISRIQKFIGQL